MTRIIRAAGPRQPARPSPQGTRVLRAGQLQCLREAEQQLAAARQRAGELLEAARSEAGELRRAAEDESRMQAAELLLRAEQRAARLAVESREELTTLAVRIAEKILGEELRLQPDRVCAIVEQCLRASGHARQVLLRVNPSDLRTVENALPRLARHGAALEVKGDPRVPAGGCVLETELGEVDGRLEAQLARLEEALR